jgi:hypothetical protein
MWHHQFVASLWTVVATLVGISLFLETNSFGKTVDFAQSTFPKQCVTWVFAATTAKVYEKIEPPLLNGSIGPLERVNP